VHRGTIANCVLLMIIPVLVPRNMNAFCNGLRLSGVVFFVGFLRLCQYLCYTVSGGRTIEEYYCGRKQPWPKRSTILEGLRKTAKMLRIADVSAEIRKRTFRMRV
jgi:hypothetical protein